MKIPEFNYTIRERTVVDILSQLENVQTFVNVGFHNWEDGRKHWWIKICEENNINWKIVEIFKHNVDDAISKGCPADKIILDDILNVDSLPDADCIMFWHGPEHVDKDKFLDVLPKLEKKYKCIIFGMPLGDEPQGPAYDNPFEIHTSSWNTEEWKQLGYEVVEVHDHQKYPHITVYKIQR